MLAQLGLGFIAPRSGHALRLRQRKNSSFSSRLRRLRLEPLESRRLLSVGVDFTQAANENPTLGELVWINSILNPNKSEYFEGVSTLQRIFLDDIEPAQDNNQHSLIFAHQAVKGEQHAYDFLTSWEDSFAAAELIAPGTLPPVPPPQPIFDEWATEAGPSSPWSDAEFQSTLMAMRGDNGANGVPVEIPGGLGDEIGDPDSLPGSDVDGKIDAYETNFGTNRELKMYGDPAKDDITGADLAFLGYDNTNEWARYELTWTSNSDMILIEFGAHLAQGSSFLGAGIGYGPGLGAGSISGAPYHVFVESVDDDALGSRDNQIQADAVRIPPELRVNIEPSDVNEVGDSHTFVVTVEQNDFLPAGATGGDQADDWGPAAGALVDVTLDGQNGAIPDVSSPVDLPPGDPSTLVDRVADANGQVFVTFTSATAGLVEGMATATKEIFGVPLQETTDGLGDNSGPALKRKVDAKIEIEPDDVNEVNVDHTFTVTVMQNDGINAGQDIDGDGVPDGDGVTGWGAPAVGTLVDVTLTGENGAIPVPPGPFNDLPTDASGQVEVTFTSLTAGLVEGSAEVDVIFDRLPSETPPATPLEVTRSTEGSETTPGSGEYNSDPAVKRFVDANIEIEPDDVNEVGDPHTFTVTVMQNDGLNDDQGGDGVTGWTPAVGAPVDVTLTPSNGANPVPSGPFIDLPTDPNGQVFVTFTSASAGQVVGSATVDVSFDRLPSEQPPATPVVVTRSTTATTGDATKTFVDAQISITRDGLNGIGQFIDISLEHHTFTARVLVDDGTGSDDDSDGSHFDVVPDGTEVIIDIEALQGAEPIDAAALQSVEGPNPVGVSGGDGEAALTFLSLTAGSAIGNASVSLLVSGELLNRDAGPVTKEFVDGELIWLKVDDNGDPLGGATFDVFVTRLWDTAENTPDPIDGTFIAVDPPFHLVTVVDDTDGTTDLGDIDRDPRPGKFKLDDLFLGTFKIVEVDAPVDYLLDPTPQSVNLTLSDPSNAANPPIFVNLQLEGRMTGGGSVFLPADGIPGEGVRVTHGFQLHSADPPELVNNRLQVNIHNPYNSNFHLETLTFVEVFDTDLVQEPRPAPIDTLVGEGVGRFSGRVDGVRYRKADAEIEFTLVDGGPLRGEPGVDDTFDVIITVLDGNQDGVANDPLVVLDSTGPLYLHHGNHQAHPEIPPLASLPPAALSIQQDIEGKLNRLDSPNINHKNALKIVDGVLVQFDEFEAALAADPLVAAAMASALADSSSTSGSSEESATDTALEELLMLTDE